MLEYSNTLISAASTGSGVASLGLSCDKSAWTFLIKTSAGVSDGVVKIETAPTESDAGTWQELASVTTSAASTTYSVHFETSVRHVRARISTTIVGGTVTVTAEAVS